MVKIDVHSLSNANPTVEPIFRKVQIVQNNPNLIVIVCDAVAQRMLQIRSKHLIVL